MHPWNLPHGAKILWFCILPLTALLYATLVIIFFFAFVVVGIFGGVMTTIKNWVLRPK